MSTENEKKLEEMLAKFEKDHPTEGKNFRALLESTPELKSRMLEAVGKGNLEKFEPLSEDERKRGTVGAYNPNESDKSIKLPMDFLAISDKNTQAANLLRSTFGHEIEHAVNRDSIKTAQDKLVTDAAGIATGPSPHNYTNVVKNYVADLRDREARDEIAGVNVLAAHIKRQNPDATKEQLYNALATASPDMALYFDKKGTKPETFQPKPGIEFSDKFQIDPSNAKNVEAFGKHFYDANNYPKTYGQGVIEVLGKIEQLVQDDAKAKDPKYKAPEVQINLKELGLEGKGIVLPSGFSEIKRSIDPALAPQQDPIRASDATQQSSTGDKHIDDLVNAKTAKELRAALDRLHDSPDGQQFRQQGQTQWQETQKSQEVSKPQTQEAPAQEAPARKAGGL